VGIAAAHALDRAVDHRLGGVEVRIADAENDDILAAVLRSRGRVMCFPGIGAIARNTLHEIRVLHPPTFCMTLLPDSSGLAYFSLRPMPS